MEIGPYPTLEATQGQIDNFFNITFVAPWPDTMDNILRMQGIVHVGQGILKGRAKFE